MAEKDLNAYVSGVSLKQQQAESLGQSLAIGVEKDPDAHAKSLAMAMKTGVAPQMAVDFPQEIGKQAKLMDLSIGNMIERNPRVSRFLATSTDNSAVAHDDTYSLSAMEYLLRPVDYVRSAVGGAGNNTFISSFRQQFNMIQFPIFPSHLQFKSSSCTKTTDTAIGQY